MSEDHDAEFDALIQQLEAAGLVEPYRKPDGKLWYRLTPKGAQVGRSLALDQEAGEAVFDALLDATEGD